MDPSQEVLCGDFLLFEAQLKSMREVDDKIINTLNTVLPSANFARADIDPASTCKDFHSQLLSLYTKRENAIKGCIVVTADKVKELSSEKEKDANNPNIIKNLRKEQTKLRMLRSELNVEEVIKEQSLKVLNERCRAYYKL